ncbi:response regulator transcription factor [Candidatus Frankia alpina]|uniref:Response regulator transcription factor n=1 Tax=Candidatus Frankia alpina TaxID=2699483 RepID=A0A4S5DZY6_9ACTN|nr:response regulator transcription factor [Candidatus Frankia alpina]THJ64598.1 response regulator transcription factor [Candidatus Frankia alpina]
MASGKNKISEFVDSFSWQDGLRSLIDEGLTNREIAEQLNLSRNGDIKMSSAVAQARRWRNAATGSARQQRGEKVGPKDMAAVDGLRRRAAAAYGGRRGFVGWQATVQSKTDKHGQGIRGQELAPFILPQAAADALARGDLDAAGTAFEAELMTQCSAGDTMEIVDFDRLDFTF